ncbi:transcriptional regulator, PadR family [Micromonospora purpureochromogenes]|uniref:Transcriptional regulator, PadR family n=1 Tax=Micromonospora purpureochromogenes TaxID=47872 RepID=A0A1C4ZSL0_9ACTN|nr:PadR family transcriptional regulator [Micromonospora purpureochromogenes]SCF36010.1 transcriptional regulator, PadR family [Micromonospora purpureochromogenes]
MALRHAVLAALLDGEYSGYQLAKTFDVSLSNFWYAVPQQLYAELAKLEREGLITGRQVIQHDRPNKRLFTVTDAGLAELAAFAATPSKPSSIREDLLVMVQAVDRLDPAPVIAQLEERAVTAAAKVEIFDRMLQRMRGELDEETFLCAGDRIGPYLTCLRGRRFEQENREWCERVAALLRARAPLPG